MSYVRHGLAYAAPAGVVLGLVFTVVHQIGGHALSGALAVWLLAAGVGAAAIGALRYGLEAETDDDMNVIEGAAGVLLVVAIAAPLVAGALTLLGAGTSFTVTIPLPTASSLMALSAWAAIVAVFGVALVVGYEELNDSGNGGESPPDDPTEMLENNGGGN